MIASILRILLGLVFFVFGAFKIVDPHAFIENVQNFQIAPFNQEPYDMWLAYVLLPLEVIVGFCLIIGRWLRGALIMSVLMTTAFIGAIGSVWMRGLNIDCGCTGGTVSLGGYPTHIAILIGMLGISVYLIIDNLFETIAE